MKAEEQRIADEKKFHNEIFSSRARRAVSKFYGIAGSVAGDFHDLIFNQPKGKRILEYGCGMGSKLLALDELGAETTGIDISDFAIDQLNAQARQKGAATRYLVMNAEQLEFADSSFDLIFGTGILHHLNLEKAFSTIRDKLKPEGSAIFIEPLGHNPLINGFRNRTPSLRTEDEHPLLMADFQTARAYFGKISVQYYYLSTLAIPVLFGKNSPAALVKVFDGLDRLIFTTLPFTRRFAWQALIKFESPLKQ